MRRSGGAQSPILGMRYRQAPGESDRILQHLNPLPWPSPCSMRRPQAERRVSVEDGHEAERRVIQESENQYDLSSTT
jgi:hypothetical protein